MSALPWTARHSLCALFNLDFKPRQTYLRWCQINQHQMKQTEAKFRLRQNAIVSDAFSLILLAYDGQKKIRIQVRLFDAAEYAVSILTHLLLKKQRQTAGIFNRRQML